MINIIDAEKIFNPGTINEVVALEKINLKVHDGEFLTFIGTNGSGKSTLLNIISGTIFSDKGKIEIDGKDVTRKKDFERAAYVSRVFQNPFSGTASHMTIAENLLIAYNRSKKRTPKINLNKPLLNYFKEEVSLLEMQLEDRLDNLIGSLSGGQRQALTLLMAVINKPKLLLLDEHTAALDPKTALQVVKLTRKFVEFNNLTTIMITHSMQQALELGTRTIMMYRGKIIEDIPEQEKNRLTVNDLLDKFADLRKKEGLTDDIYEQLRREYF
ncbi:MAG: ATP-binding cassette domain-containing protein [Ignavibacteriales bacterium]|nr:ATP-binding cassette domain-containing protein [Ignavibacteriales bacterium]